MRKRRRLLTPQKKSKYNRNLDLDESNDQEVTTARDRLKGALLDALELYAEDDNYDTPYRRERAPRESKHSETSDDEEKTAQRQSYVLKLFDRSVDLSQFEENAPLYPICRAWIINQPKINYKALGNKKEEEPCTELNVQLPGPDGPEISKIPELLPIQEQRKENINLDYAAAPPPSREQLLQAHIGRWTAVRQAWIEQASKVEARYEATQRVLNTVNVSLM